MHVLPFVYYLVRYCSLSTNMWKILNVLYLWKLFPELLLQRYSKSKKFTYTVQEILFFSKNPNNFIGIGKYWLYFVFWFSIFWYCFGIVSPQNCRYWAVLCLYLVLYCYCMFALFCQKGSNLLIISWII